MRVPELPMVQAKGLELVMNLVTRWRDALIHVEQTCRVVASLDLLQPVIVWTAGVSQRHPLLFTESREIQVDIVNGIHHECA